MKIEPKAVAERVKLTGQKIKRLLHEPDFFAANINQLSLQLPEFCDFGFPIETCDLIDRLEDSLDPESDDFLRVKCFRMHMDISRRKRLDAIKNLAAELQQASNSEWRAHGLFAGGMLFVFSGCFVEAREMFRQAQGCFQKAGLGVYAAKLGVAQAMTYRAQNLNDESFQMIERQIPEVEQLGADGISPLIVLYSAAASHCLDLKRNYCARSFSWQAVRLSKALPRSKSSGFVLFQHGRIEQELGCSKKAVSYLQQAEKIQNILDPVARIATRIHLLRAWRDLGLWQQGERVLTSLWDDPNSSIHESDFSEMFEECVMFYLDTHAPDKARQLSRRLVGIKMLTDQRRQKLTEWAQEKISAYVQSWDRALVLRDQSLKTEDFLKIDFASGIARGLDGKGGVRSIEFRAQSSVDLLLRYLTEHKDGAPLHDCLEHFRSGWDRQRAQLTRSLQKTLKRSVNSLVNAGIAESWDLHDKTLIQFRPGMRVLVLGR